MKTLHLVLLAIYFALFAASAAQAEPRHKRHAAAGAPETSNSAVKKIPVKVRTRERERSRKQAIAKRKVAFTKRGNSQTLENAHRLLVQSAAALVLDAGSGEVIYQKNANAVVPIASITKLMTAMVALDAKPDMDETLSITAQDVDTLKGSRSRLTVGASFTRAELLNLALMSSENRAAYALSRAYPGGREVFVAAMNRKARELGLTETRFADPTGLTAENTSSARDLAKMVAAAHEYPLIRKYTTTVEREFNVAGRTQMYRNTNSLIKNSAWDIELSKTGYISEAGKCLVMFAAMNDRPTIIVLLDAQGKLTRLGDANRIKRWMESAALSPSRREAAG